MSEVSKQLDEAVSVAFSTSEDVRRALFLHLDGLPERQRLALASKLTKVLRDGGWLASSVEQHYKAAQVAQLVARTPEHVVAQAKAGAFGVVYRDDGGWIIPASGVQQWLMGKIYSGSVRNPESEVVA